MWMKWVGPDYLRTGLDFPFGCDLIYYFAVDDDMIS